MEIIIELTEGKAAKMTYYHSVDFGGRNFYEINELMTRIGRNGNALDEDQEARLAELKEIKGWRKVIPQEIYITDFRPIAFNYIPTAHVLKWVDLNIIKNMVMDMEATLQEDGPVPLWTQEHGIFWEE